MLKSGGIQNKPAGKSGKLLTSRAYNKLSYLRPSLGHAAERLHQLFAGMRRLQVRHTLGFNPKTRPGEASKLTSREWNENKTATHMNSARVSNFSTKRLPNQACPLVVDQAVHLAHENGTQGLMADRISASIIPQTVWFEHVRFHALQGRDDVAKARWGVSLKSISKHGG